MSTQEYWYDTPGQQNIGATQKEGRPRKTVSFPALIACMLITAILGGGLGGLIATAGERAKAPEPQSSQILGGQPTLPSVQQEWQTIQPADTSAVTGGVYTKVQIVEMTAPSIVGIDILAQSRSSSRSGQDVTVGSGSGIIVSQDGYIITNNHVIAGAPRIMVYLNDNTEYEAKVVASDRKTDLAVIKIEATGLKPVVMGESDMVVVGEDVVAIGNPLGEFRGTATSGMISALSRTIDIDGETMTLLQTDAAISPGNSGGGLFNMRGELVGVINAKVVVSSAEGLGFAIPVSSAKNVVADLMDLGYVSGRAYLGVYVENVALEAESGSGDGNSAYGFEDFFGFFGDGRRATSYETRVRIMSVVLGSAADKAGLHAGDIVLQIGDTEIRTSSELLQAIDEYNAGDVANIKVQRDGEEIIVSATFGEYIPE